MSRELCHSIRVGESKIAVIGLGYVGLPLAVAFARKARVIGYDKNVRKIEAYRQGFDPTGEVGSEALTRSSIILTSDEASLRDARFHVIAVPTPINSDRTPDLSPVIEASRVVGRNLRPDSIVVYESTVFPGVTEEVCIPILEAESNLRVGVDFSVGYSPERINPGDRVHTLETIVKIVSATDCESLEAIAQIYELIVKAGTHRVSSIATAEAIKVVENSQRDINIAFMNEIAMVFDRMGISTAEVVEGMNTKWNALGFRPGLVGGHCIGVDPYYFIYRAEHLGYHSQIVAPGRRINRGMGKFVADAAIKQIVATGRPVKNSRVGLLGVTFKENCPDSRNSAVIDIVTRLREYGIDPLVVDPVADYEEVLAEHSIELAPHAALKELDCLVVAVAHDQFRSIDASQLDAMYSDQGRGQRVLIDVKSLYDGAELVSRGYLYWSL